MGRNRSLCGCLCDTDEADRQYEIVSKVKPNDHACNYDILLFLFVL